MRLILMLVVSLFFLSSCSMLRSAMITSMDVVTAPAHWFDDADYDEKDHTIN
ncbi:MAG: hypothetical protein Q9M31_10645 [Mariprofundus sp.]|nr:hypothetical protein [Mariprofundus sp.]